MPRELCPFWGGVAVTFVAPLAPVQCSCAAQRLLGDGDGFLLELFLDLNFLSTVASIWLSSINIDRDPYESH